MNQFEGVDSAGRASGRGSAGGPTGGRAKADRNGLADRATPLDLAIEKWLVRRWAPVRVMCGEPRGSDHLRPASGAGPIELSSSEQIAKTRTAPADARRPSLDLLNDRLRSEVGRWRTRGHAGRPPGWPHGREPTQGRFAPSTDGGTALRNEGRHLYARSLRWGQAWGLCRRERERGAGTDPRLSMVCANPMEQTESLRARPFAPNTRWPRRSASY